MSNHQFALAESVSTPDIFFIPIYILILIYCCFGLAVVCDVYFVPALQKLSSTYDLPPDIAGSTLMALGASVPELFASLIGVFITEDDIGTGSIIGSSCFNLIAVPAACAFVASTTFSRKVSLSAFPVLRNLSFYVITVLVLILIIEDNIVEIPEALILLLFFVMYMAFMVFSTQYKSYFGITSSSLTDSCVSNNSDVEGSSVNKLITLYDSGRQVITMNSNSNYSNIESSLSDICIPVAVNCAAKVMSEKTPLLSNDFVAANIELRDNLSAGSYNKNLVPPRMSNCSVVANSAQKEIDNDQMINMRATINTSLPANTNHISCSNQSYLGAKRAFDPTSCKHSSRAANLAADLTNGYQNVNNNNNNNNINNSYSNKHECSFSTGCVQTATTQTHHSTTATMNSVHRQLYVNANGSGASGRYSEIGADTSTWLHSYWILIPMLPVTLCMKMLAPCKFKSTFWTIWTFLVSVCLIGALTYLSVWTVHCFGQALGIPETVAGMTILSWGTGIPELIASIVLIRKTGAADMAICNTTGSNVIDISFCLSLPWLVKCFMHISAGYEPVVSIKSAALPWSCLTLLFSVVCLVLVLRAYKWELNWQVGTWLLVIYACFVVTATFLEYTYCETGLNLLTLFQSKATPEWRLTDGEGAKFKFHIAYERAKNKTMETTQTITKSI